MVYKVAGDGHKVSYAGSKLMCLSFKIFRSRPSAARRLRSQRYDTLFVPVKMTDILDNDHVARNARTHVHEEKGDYFVKYTYCVESSDLSSMAPPNHWLVLALQDVSICGSRFALLQTSIH